MAADSLLAGSDFAVSDRCRANQSNRSSQSVDRCRKAYPKWGTVRVRNIFKSRVGHHRREVSSVRNGTFIVRLCRFGRSGPLVRTGIPALAALNPFASDTATARCEERSLPAGLNQDCSSLKTRNPLRELAHATLLIARPFTFRLSIHVQGKRNVV
jgi:hypothetical protein